VTLSEDKKISIVRIPKEEVTKKDITEMSLTTRLFSDEGTYCRRQQFKILLGVGRFR
jgi:hypothetical protein